MIRCMAHMPLIPIDALAGSTPAAVIMLGIGLALSVISHRIAAEAESNPGN